MSQQSRNARQEAGARQLVNCAECFGEGFVDADREQVCPDCDGAGSFYVTYIDPFAVKVDRLPEGDECLSSLGTV